MYVLYKNFRSPLNRTCAAILVAFAIWSFGTIVRHENHYSSELVSMMMDVSALGWTSFSAFGVWFIFIFTERWSLLHRRWFLPLLFESEGNGPQAHYSPLSGPAADRPRRQNSPD